MIKNRGWKLLGMMCVCSAVLFANPAKAEAAEAEEGAVVKVEAEQVSLYSEMSAESAVVEQASQGDTYEVVEDNGDGWVKVFSESGEEGYLMADGKSAVVEAEAGDPNTGTDCSGFTSYVLEHAGGVDMNRSSRSQAAQGTQVSAEQMQPGDLVFYANGSRINHVGLYIGDGQIVHASTERTGIKISPWTYRNPVKIVSVLG